jgi:protein-disulfide isomerase
MKRYLPFIIIGVVFLGALGAGLALYRSSQAPPATQQQTPANAPNMFESYSPHVRGGNNAPVTLEEYGDYQCPPCGLLFHDLKTIEKEYGDQMRFVFRHFPLQSHKNAVPAAQAAEAAGLQGHFWEMHDMIYQNQASWSPVDDARPVFIQYARDLKLDVDRFTRDMESAEVAARVRSDYQRGVSMKVEGTPTLFINGRQLRPEATTIEGLRMALDYMLGKKK